jgi:D-3-phosphoglycerate dehydrogenase
MAIISYLNSFPAPNALAMLARDSQHEVIRIDGNDSDQRNFDILGSANAYQCVGARDEVPVSLRVDAEFLQKTPNLLVVSASGSGVDVFDLPACTKAGVLAVNQAGSNAESVAEHAISMMIGLQKHISAADRALRIGWGGSRLAFTGRDLFGKTIGIVGLGNIGSRLAQICRAGFGCQVVAVDPYLSPEEVRERGAEPTDFDTLLQASDIISVHTPLTEETRGMFNKCAFSKMKKGAIFITTARGSIHDEQALADALASGHLSGAGLDVWEIEPPAKDHPLLKMDNVIATPHVSGSTADSLENMAQYAASQLLDLFEGKPPLRPVNPEVLPFFEKRFKTILGSVIDR